jgi:hypothetical protein
MHAYKDPGLQRLYRHTGGESSHQQLGVGALRATQQNLTFTLCLFYVLKLLANCEIYVAFFT